MPRRGGISAWTVAAVLGLALILVVALGIWSGWDLKTLIGWKPLVDYIDPKNATDRKDAVQVYAVIVAGVIATITGGIGLANLRLTRRNLEQQRELEGQRAQGAALQSYYEQIGKLLSDMELHSTERTEIRELARGHTLTVLQDLDAGRKGSLLAFLQGAQLIGSKNPAFELNGADLMHANLQEAFLAYANLQVVNLHGALLQGANLWKANLQGAMLQGALLEEANLQGALLAGADLSGADLTEADLSGAELGAKLSKVTHVGLSGANLTDISGITDEQLVAQAVSLTSAIMPNGQKYEDWLKDKEGRGKDVKNE